MRLLLNSGEHRALIEIDDPATSQGATFGELLVGVESALSVESGTLAERRWFYGSTRLTTSDDLGSLGLVDGAEVTDRPFAGSRRPSRKHTLAVTAGLDAGSVRELQTARVVVGRSPDADLTIEVSALDDFHLAVDPVGSAALVSDLGSTNGTRLDGNWICRQSAFEPGSTLDLGASRLELSTQAHDKPNEMLAFSIAAADGATAFNRPPRQPPPQPLDRIIVPAEPKPKKLSTFFSWASLLGPVAMGAVMALLFNPLWAIFALLGPVMMIGTWIENKRKNKKTSRHSSRQMAKALAELEIRVDQLKAAEVQRRHVCDPNVAEVIRRIDQPSVRLWERRLTDDDGYRLTVGHATLRWPIDLAADGGEPATEAIETVESVRNLPDVPVAASVAAGDVIGIVGNRKAALRVARSLVIQAAGLHGPADLELAVFSHDRSSWRWAEWLPHLKNRAFRSGRARVAWSPDVVAELTERLVATAPKVEPNAATDQPTIGPQLVCVIDGDELLTSRTAPARTLFGGKAGLVGGIVIATSHEQLPNCTTTIVDVLDPDGLGRVGTPESNTIVENVLLMGVTEATAQRSARRMARFVDPEVDQSEASIPAKVDLVRLLDLDGVTDRSIAASWLANSTDRELKFPVGADGMGTLDLDLVKDGPHALMGGTTGSGKSELLRSIVAGMAARYSPDDLNFVLIDYKGGAAFDKCAELPHTVGMVTDLDEHLGARALACLEAELHYRETVLRSVGATDIVEYRSAPRQITLPRLVVVIDEFATLAAELPEFLDSLVGIAQLGRSLGVHLILATQRPAGCISQNIRANTNLRIALRFVDPTDSQDVLDSPKAATISSDQPGRAFVRLGPTEVVPFQAALVTGATPDEGAATLRVTPLLSPGVAAPTVASLVGETTESDLERIVAAATDAHAGGRFAPLRSPWPAPLPAKVSLAELAPKHSLVRIGMADLPKDQTQEPAYWDPNAGSAALFGMPGSGTSTALRCLATSWASELTPAKLHIYGIDNGSGELGPLSALTHVGSIVDGIDQSRQVRLLSMLEAERKRRSVMTKDEVSRLPRILVLVDGYGAWASELEAGRNFERHRSFVRTFSDGPAVGIHCAVSAEYASAVRREMLSSTNQVWAFKLADPIDYTSFEIKTKPNTDNMAPGRAFSALSATEIQFFEPTNSDIEASNAVPYAAGTEAGPIRDLPAEVTLSELKAKPSLVGEPVTLPVGLRDSDLGVASLTLFRGEHAMVCGRSRTGKSTVLTTIGSSLLQAGICVVALSTSRSPLRELSGATHAVDEAGVTEAVEAVAESTPVVTLVDDAERFADKGDHLAGLITSSSERAGALVVVGAGRIDALKRAYGSWTQSLSAARTGLVLNPEVLDGDVFGVQLPTKPAVARLPGRGYLVNSGVPELVQVALPDLTPDRATA